MSFVPTKEDSCVCTLLEKMGALTKEELARVRSEKEARSFQGHTSALALEMDLITPEQLSQAIAYNKRMLAGEAVDVMMELADNSATFVLSQLDNL